MSAPVTLPLNSPAIAEPAPARNSLRVIKRLFRQPLSVAAISWILLVLLSAIFAPLLAPYDPLDNNFADILQGPSAEHWLGTDENGRDVLSRMLFGADRPAVGFGAVAIAMLIGVPLGMLLGFRAGWWTDWHAVDRHSRRASRHRRRVRDHRGARSRTDLHHAGDRHHLRDELLADGTRSPSPTV